MVSEIETKFASWKTPEIPLEIEYSLVVMDEIRVAACAALRELPVGEREAGGVLFGERRGSSISVKTWRPIVWDHANGPTLRLLAPDQLKLACLLELARSSDDLKDLQPVGWFVSHPRATVGMCASDLEVYDSFFPYAWQVTLIVRPAKDGRARCGFFVRTADGTLRSDSSYREFDLEPVHWPAIAEPPPLFSWMGEQNLAADPTKKKLRHEVKVTIALPEQAIGAPPVLALRPKPKGSSRVLGALHPVVAFRRLSRATFPISRPASKTFLALVILLVLGSSVFFLKRRPGQIVPAESSGSKAISTPASPSSDITALLAERDALQAQVSQLRESVRQQDGENNRLASLRNHDNQAASPAAQAKEAASPIQPAVEVAAKAETPQIQKTAAVQPTQPIVRAFRPPSSVQGDGPPVVVLTPPESVASESVVPAVKLPEATPQIPPPPVKETPAAKQTPPPKETKVGGKLEPGSLIQRVAPVYPPLAKSRGIEGTVRFIATIGKDGTIQKLQLVSGNPALVAAAREAVTKWIYRPTLLNGEPVEVTTQIQLNFSLKK